MPHHPTFSQHPMPRKLLARHRVVVACAAVAVLAAAVLLLAAPTTEDPGGAYLVDSLLAGSREEPQVAADGLFAGASSPSPDEAPLPSVLEANLSSRIAPAPSMFLVPAPPLAENFDDGTMEEPEHPEIKENPLKESTPFLQEAPLWSTAADEELANAPFVSDDHDSDMYASLFRNVSVFKRSYELMEGLLKISQEEFSSVEEMCPFQKHFLDHQEDLKEILVENQLHRDVPKLKEIDPVANS